MSKTDQSGKSVIWVSKETHKDLKVAAMASGMELGAWADAVLKPAAKKFVDEWALKRIKSESSTTGEIAIAREAS